MRKKKMGLAFYGGIILLGLCGCRETQPQIPVSISQGQVETRLFVEKGSSVQSILKEAEIIYGKEDVISPSPDTRIESDNAEIIIEACNRIILLEDDVTTEMQFNGGKVKDVLKEAEIVLDENDYVNHDTEAYLSEGMNIKVLHRIAVNINVDGQKQEYLTGAKTVQELLEEQGIHLGKKDRVKPKKETELAEGTTVVIKRVDVKKVTEKEPVSFEIKTQYSNALYTGESQIKQRGTEGEKEVTYEVTYVDGKEEKRKVLKEKVIKEPVPQIVIQGTKPRKQIVDRKRYDDWDGSGHGYEVITLSDGTTEVRHY